MLDFNKRAPTILIHVWMSVETTRRNCSPSLTKIRSFHLHFSFQQHTRVHFYLRFPPKKAGGPWTVAVCQPCRTLNVKEKNAWERRFPLRLSQRPTKSEVEFLFFQPSYWQRRWEAKTLEQETTFQLSLGIRPTQWKLWRSCTPERLEGRISCVIGGIYTLPVKNRGPRTRYQLLWGSGGRGESLENSSGLKGRVLTGERRSQLEKSS